MVVSAILTTALAPITGALFGASYGTSIRIGYEIIFPALFGDLINEQKNNPTKLQQDGSKRTIEAMHKMFTGVGGASAMEFGIEQGIEMAKKKTESPDVQNMIDLSLGLTEGQLKKKGKVGKSETFQDPIKDKDEFPKVKDFFEKDLGDFEGETNREIEIFFKQFTLREPFDNAFKLLLKDKGNTTFTQQIWLLRPPAPNVKDAIDKAAPKGSVVNEIARLFHDVVAMLNVLKKIKKSNPAKFQSFSKDLFTFMKRYNRYVQSIGKRDLTIDTAKTLQQLKIVKRF